MRAYDLKRLAIAFCLVSGFAVSVWHWRPRVVVLPPDVANGVSVLSPPQNQVGLSTYGVSSQDPNVNRPARARRESPALADPHNSPVALGDQVRIRSVDRAPGKRGRRVAEVYAERRELVGQRVRIRGVVVRCVPGVLGRVFVHLRDGSGNPQNGDHDLTLTSRNQARVGETALYEGTVVNDKDFGSGYRYLVMLEDAEIMSDENSR